MELSERVLAMNDRIRGVWCANLTPLDGQGGIHHGLLVAHVHWLLASGVDGVAPFGTTGEGQSFSLRERRDGLEALLRAGIDARRIAPGTGCAAIPETIELTKHALECGCVHTLVLPPFYIKGIGDEGLYASYARVINAIADDRLRLYLYHIPQMSGVPIGFDVIARLVAAYPDTIAGVKDSGADLAHEQALIARFPNLNVLVGYESHLPEALANGGAGTIGGLANLIPDVMRRLHDATTDAARLQELDCIDRLRKVLEPHWRMPALKALTAQRTGARTWSAVREPLLPLDDGACRSLATGFLNSGINRASV
jgi:4-hydroxy-tetrahydrodipicolinate synthase